MKMAKSSLNYKKTLWEKEKLLVTSNFSFSLSGVLRGSVVKCLTRNPGVLGSSCTGSSGFFRWSVLGKNTSEPKPSTCETQERHKLCELSP